MYIPTFQNIVAAGLALSGSTAVFKSKPVAEGSILDFAVEKCLDGDGNLRCTTPFLVTKSTCYEIEWSTEGTFSHTTAEIYDAGSDELVYYRDLNGQWTPEKGELVYMAFRPRIYNTGNSTVDYKVTYCKE